MEKHDGPARLRSDAPRELRGGASRGCGRWRRTACRAHGLASPDSPRREPDGVGRRRHRAAAGQRAGSGSRRPDRDSRSGRKESGRARRSGRAHASRAGEAHWLRCDVGRRHRAVADAESRDSRRRFIHARRQCERLDRHSGRGRTAGRAANDPHQLQARRQRCRDDSRAGQMPMPSDGVAQSQRRARFASGGCRSW